jgi:Tfp pilus assembly PilM family ATPase
MEEQIAKALEKDTKVEVCVTRSFFSFFSRECQSNTVRLQKVLLIGGFADSVSLRRYLSERLKTFCRQKNCPVPILLHPPKTYVQSNIIALTKNG